MKHEARSTKHKKNSKLEISNSKHVLDFGLGIWDLFRVSGFGFRISTPKRGVTLLETLVAMAVLVAVSLAIMGGLASFREAAALNQAVDEALGLLREARAKTLGSEGAIGYGVHFSPGSVTLFPGGTYTADNPLNVIVMLPKAVMVSDIALSTTTGSVVFERLSGQSPAAGTVSFTAIRSGRIKTIQILSSGIFLTP